MRRIGFWTCGLLFSGVALGWFYFTPTRIEAGEFSRLEHRDRFSGIVVERYQNGALYREVEIKKGIQSGIAKKYAVNGRLIERGYFKDGKRDGLVEGWFEEGPKRFEYHFKDAVLDGAQTQWHMNGKVFRQEIFSNGIEVDKKILFAGGEIFTNYAKRDGRIYGLDGGALCMESKREGVK